MSNRYDVTLAPRLEIGFKNVGTKTGLAMGSVYAFATSGAALGYRFTAPASGNLTDVYFFVNAIVGTPGVITVELRTTNALKPGSSLLASQTVSPGTSANKWIKCTFSSPYSLTQGAVYWIVIGDAGWTTGNTATVLYYGGCSGWYSDWLSGYSTADGFTTNGSPLTTSHPVIAFNIAGTSFGQPYTNSASDTSNTLERGNKILGLTEDLLLCGVGIGATSGNQQYLKIYSGSAAPGSTPDYQLTINQTGAADQPLRLFSPVTLRKNTLYRVVIAYNGSTGNPGYSIVEDYATGGSDLLNCTVGGGRFYRTIDNGAGGWTDNVDRYEKISLFFQDQVAQMHSRYIMGLGGS